MNFDDEETKEIITTKHMNDSGLKNTASQLQMSVDELKDSQIDLTDSLQHLFVCPITL